MGSKQSKTMRIVFFVYFVPILILLAYGFMYLFKSRFMPYHAQSIGLSWEQVDSGFQVVILSLMRVVGGSFLALATVLLMILLIPFRNGTRWAYYAVPVTGFLCGGASLYATLGVHLQTGADTPWVAAGIPLVIYLIGLILAVIDGRKKTEP